MIRFALRRLRHNRRGATIIEFAMVAPVLLMLLMGLFDLMHQIYAQSILDGALQKAARDSAIEGGAQQTNTFDQQVYDMVKLVVPDSTYVAKRRSYATFQSIKPEDFTDKNGNGKCDNGESYTDINGNSTWDIDPGANSQGSAEDVTQYTMTINYPRLFPVAGLFGWSNAMSISATTLLKNQPYDAQKVTTAVVRKCP